jgi:hypothetical protein
VTYATDTAVRLAACDIVRTRFAGRADLRRAAEHCTITLARLEVRLGLAPESAIADAEWARRTEILLLIAAEAPGTASRCATLLLLAGEDREARQYWARRLSATAGAERGRRLAMRRAAPAEYEAVSALRAQRAAARAVQPRPALSERLRRLPRMRAALVEAERVVDASGLRVATHGHRDRYTPVLRGREGASSDTGSSRPQDVGLGRSYARVAFTVTTSAHCWSVSAAILDPEVQRANAAAGVGIVYLATDTRVRNGRGTSLVVERLTARGAWRAA